MSSAIDWIKDRIPHYVNGENELMLRWTNQEGNPQEAPLNYVADRFGSTIDQALSSGEDVVEAIRLGNFDVAWKGIWQLWRGYGWV